MLTTSELTLLRAKALRRGLWFKVLSRIERSIYHVTIKSVDRIRSRRLLSLIRAIVDKLKRALESPIAVLTRSIGRQLATLFARVAYSFGNINAQEWANDEGFARYLAVCYASTPDGLRFLTSTRANTAINQIADKYSI